MSLVIDAGCGSGGMLRELAGYKAVFGVELAPEAIEFAARQTPHPILRGNVRQLPFLNNVADVVMSLDVLCSIEGDFEVETILEFRRALRPGGLLMLNLPAHKFMAGAHDRWMGVRRRYESHEVRNFIAGADMRLLEIFHWNMFLLPAGYIIRKLTDRRSDKPHSDLDVTPAWCDPLLYRFMMIDISFCRLISSPVGASIFCVAQKPE
ncbi:MAG TPA: class I SAM-dependent methyltransferase [Candidatus Brocadiia bacterium]|nr:class I SAM-dependent methyltransferase [Candidatus Brocadiia bacterium]